MDNDRHEREGDYICTQVLNLVLLLDRYRRRSIDPFKPPRNNQEDR